jgi:hypothetical protein
MILKFMEKMVLAVSKVFPTMMLLVFLLGS